MNLIISAGNGVSLFHDFCFHSKCNLTLTYNCSHTSLPTSPPLHATLMLLIGEQTQHPLPIRSQHEQEDLRKLRLDPEDVQHSADLYRSHDHETTEVSHMSKGIMGDLTHSSGLPLRGRRGRRKQSRRLQPAEKDKYKS